MSGPFKMKGWSPFTRKLKTKEKHFLEKDITGPRADVDPDAPGIPGFPGYEPPVDPEELFKKSTKTTKKQ